jgi:hypothetical protein
LAEKLKAEMAKWSKDLNADGLHLGEDLGVEMTTDGATVNLALEADPMAVFLSLWTSGMFDPATEDAKAE